MKFKSVFLYSLLCFLLNVSFNASGAALDSTDVIALNKKAYNNRLTNPAELITQANKALALATKIGYVNGMAEANRVIGIGYYYQTKQVEALKYYLVAQKIYQDANNQDGVAKVTNNIGNLYRESDYDEAIKNYESALNVALKVKDEDLIATIYLNFGSIYYRKKNLNKALEYYEMSNVLFKKLNNTVNLIQCLQNKGVIYYNQNKLDTALVLLLQANAQAKEKDLNTAVASINLTLTSIFIAKNQFDKAEHYLEEGLNYATLVNSDKLKYDYKLTRFQLESKRKNYQVALSLLYEIYRADSIKNHTDVSNSLKLLKEQTKQEENEHNNEMMLAQRSRDRILFWSTVLVAGLLVVLVILLINNVNRKAKTNQDLTRLNEKITEQKENLNQINHHLEEIIDDRTKDLQIKNKKLADYSLHLSHQIRGPIATLKGLLNLEKDNLIEQDECIKLMNKCVSEIDDNIIDMSGMLHETSKKV
ncbi:tetratricopeptide repeat protein [Mucilaginibacter sp. PPCGB 2223]|uniref:tetratricopeptide repeat protein n=1 Tax=Mucilaginibacter sp. PPCGB 2223 TaxID=1886027 RepID=UPI001111E3B3|nr:tetratricopeptide repeat protein [Mucilaginibacter sp. PPCGB 2223]